MSKSRLLYIVVSILLLALIASFMGTLTLFGDSQIYPFITYRGEVVYLLGQGVYRHMGEIMAHQGAAQDLVTLFVALPLLILGAVKYDPMNLKSSVFLSGVVAYIAVTYTLYLFMATFNQLFLVYVLLAGISVSLLVYLLYKLFVMETPRDAINSRLAFYGGVTLMGITSVMGLLWLSVIMPSIIDQNVIPGPLDHYTTLVVQGADLAFFLPWIFFSGYKASKMHVKGYVFMNVSMVFVSLLMLALSAKIIVAMFMGESGMPAIILLPTFMALSVLHVLWFIISPSKNHG